MKRIFKLMMILALVFSTSCQKDNYEAPNATISGSFIDIDTGELVPQDIFNGTVIEYVEEGYTTIQNMVVKNDGTYRNAMMFANNYTIVPRRGNFEPVDPVVVKVKGNTKLNFEVKPYIRVSNVKIFKNGPKVRATFSIEQTGYDKVKTVGVFASREPNVGATLFEEKMEMSVNARLNGSKTYTLTIDTSKGTFKAGKSYFFRVGALIDVPEAKYNYATDLVRIDI